MEVSVTTSDALLHTKFESKNLDFLTHLKTSSQMQHFLIVYEKPNCLAHPFVFPPPTQKIATSSKPWFWAENFSFVLVLNSLKCVFCKNFEKY